MSARNRLFGTVALACVLATAGCGGKTVLPDSGNGIPSAPATTPTPGPGVTSQATTPGTTPLEPPVGTAAAGPPFTVDGSVRLEAGLDVDARKSFNDCQRAATQHAADTLDPSFDPTGLCIRKKGTSCTGIAAMRKLRAGAVVRITDGAGAASGTGHLKRGTLSRPMTLMGARPSCVFPFTVNGVPGGSSSYAVEVGGLRSTFTQAGARNVVVAVPDE
ncbi:MAG: hypothetical protein ACJ72E_00315 [Marmoricola sp.]